MKRWLQPLLDFVYPPFCVVCDGPLKGGENYVCDDCWGNLEFYEGEVCHGLTNRSHIDEILTTFVYDDPMKRIMHYLKYKKARRIGAQLASYMVRLLQHPGLRRPDMLIPVPLHKIKRRERGYNQSEILAVHLSRLTGIPCRPEIVIRCRNTVSQTQMTGAEERVRNVAGIFTVTDAHAVTGRSVALLDDVVTTGATANAAALALKTAGAFHVTLLTVAHPVLRDI